MQLCFSSCRYFGVFLKAHEHVNKHFCSSLKFGFRDFPAVGFVCLFALFVYSEHIVMCTSGFSITCA